MNQPDDPGVYEPLPREPIWRNPWVRMNVVAALIAFGLFAAVWLTGD